MRFYFLWLVLFCTPLAVADWIVNDPLGAVVKVRSGMQGLPVRFTGSGLAFRYERQLYVLTSDHVLARQNDPFLHSVFLMGQSYRAEFIFSDWGRRVALLRVHDVPDDVLNQPTLPDFKDLWLEQIPWRERFDSYGFPLNSYRCHASSSSLWASSSTYKYIAVQISFLLASQDVYGEFGMSGGPVLHRDRHNGRISLIGLLSHRVYSSPALLPEQTLAIPYMEVAPVIRDILLTGTSALWNFYEQATSGNELEVVDSGPLTLAVELNSSGVERMVINYYRDRQNLTRLYPDSFGWLEKVRQFLHAQSNDSVTSLKVIGFRNGQDSLVYPLEIRNLTEFIRLLDHPDWTPVTKPVLTEIDSNLSTHK